MPWATPILDQATGITHVEHGGHPLITIAPLRTQLLQAEIINGATDPIQGWVSFFSGEKVAAPVLVYRKETQVPTCFITVLYPHPANSGAELHVTNLTVTLNDGRLADETEISGLIIETAEHVDTCIVAHNGTLPWKAFIDYESDGDLVHVRRKKSDGAIVQVIMKGGHKLLFQGQPVLKGHDSRKSIIFDGEITAWEKR